MTYVNPLAGLTPRATIQNLGRTDEGVDVTGSGPVYAMGAGTVESIYANWPGGGFISIKLDNPIGGHQYYYTAENIKPSVSVGQHVAAGQTIGQAVGTYPYLELGWGTATPGVALAAPVYTEGQPTAAGLNFRSVLTALMSGQQPAGTTTTTPNATLTSAQLGGSGCLILMPAAALLVLLLLLIAVASRLAGGRRHPESPSAPPSAEPAVAAPTRPGSPGSQPAPPSPPSVPAAQTSGPAAAPAARQSDPAGRQAQDGHDQNPRRPPPG